MRLKQRVGDFKVRELLAPGYLRERGPLRVYRVTKRKRTTPEAVAALADEAGVELEAIGIAGLKDRQGITVQHMSVAGGREVQLESEDLRIEPIGYASEPLHSTHSEGNAFEITIRALHPDELDALRSNLETVRTHGLPNYFDDQRFGNLRGGQGWVALDLMRGDLRGGLHRLLCEPSPFDDERHLRLKRALDQSFGDWHACLEHARRLGVHRSLFEHLVDHPDDFGGAFRFVSAKVRLIQLYAWQSHLWNRAVTRWLRSALPLAERVLLDCIEGPLVCPAGALPPAMQATDSFPLPGPGFDGVTDPRHQDLLAEVLADEGLVPDQFRIEGVPGFQLKPEDRPLSIVPRYLRVRPPEYDPENRGLKLIRLRFDLPRGAYATLVVKRLCATRVGDERAADRPDRERGARGQQWPSSPPERGGRRDSWGGRDGRPHRGRDRGTEGPDGRLDRRQGPRWAPGREPWGAAPSGPQRGDRERRSWGHRDGERGGPQRGAAERRDFERRDFERRDFERRDSERGGTDRRGPGQRGYPQRGEAGAQGSGRGTGRDDRRPWRGSHPDSARGPDRGAGFGSADPRRGPRAPRDPRERGDGRRDRPGGEWRGERPRGEFPRDRS
jgi:tRNA pseudouridine13 synthase